MRSLPVPSRLVDSPAHAHRYAEGNRVARRLVRDPIDVRGSPEPSLEIIGRCDEELLRRVVDRRLHDVTIDRAASARGRSLGPAPSSMTPRMRSASVDGDAAGRDGDAAEQQERASDGNRGGGDLHGGVRNRGGDGDVVGVAALRLRNRRDDGQVTRSALRREGHMNELPSGVVVLGWVFSPGDALAPGRTQIEAPPKFPDTVNGRPACGPGLGRDDAAARMGSFRLGVGRRRRR